MTDGLGHLDEAMLYAVEGKLNPYTTGKVYCSLISACEQLGDLSRAAEWTDATLHWSEDHPMAMWPASAESTTPRCSSSVATGARPT